MLTTILCVVVAANVGLVLTALLASRHDTDLGGV